MPSHKSSPSKHVIARFAGTVLGLALFGMMVGLAGAAIGAALLRGDFAGFGGLAGGLAGFTIGYAAGVVAGLVILNRLLRLHGSLPVGITGALAGIALPVLFAEQLNVNPDVFFSLYFAAPTILGAAGYYFVRRH